MTFLHFVNCMALTFAPYYIMYKATRLGEYRAISLLIYGGAAYICTQLVKMLLIASFASSGETNGFDVINELFRSLINIGDVLGVYFVLTSIGGAYGSDLRILGVAVGWAAAESLATRLAPLWIGARTLEFDWIYTQMGIEANFSLILYCGFVTLVWLWSRKKLDKRLTSLVGLSLALATVIFPFIESYVRSSQSIWLLLIFHGSYSVLIGLLGWSFYSNFVSISSKQS